MDSVVEAFLEKGERVKAEERRAGISGRFTTGTLIVMPGRRTESFARGMIGIVAVAAKPMMAGERMYAASGGNSSHRQRC
jgi:hypothetical protein